MRKLALALLTLLVCAGTASASTITYRAILNGANEAPPNASLGTGIAYVTIDDVLNTMLVEASFSGLGSPNNAAHIHCCTAAPFSGTAGVATVTPTFTDFPAGTTSGSYTHLFDLTSAGTYNPAFVTAHLGLAGAEADFLAGMAAGRTYFNIHTTLIGSGEIRGFLQPVPEPATLMLVGLGVAGMARRRLRKS
jgi:hypothetical protein